LVVVLFRDYSAAPDLLMTGNCRILGVVVFLLGLVLAVSTRAGATAMTPPPLSAGATTPTRGEYAIVRAMNAVRARKGYFDHGAFVQRLRSFGVRAPYIGENLAYGTQALTAAAIVQMWITSPPHRQNLLDRGFRLIGVGVAGSSRKLITADFAGR
jgi:hypothetical protein